MNLFEKTVSMESIYNGKIIKLEKLEVLLPNGEIGQREIVRHNGAVAIIAMDKDEKILFVEQFRKTINQVLLEIPAGKIELGEEHLTCAMRELEEETGYKAKEFKFLGKIVMTPGFSDEIIYLYYATELYRGLKGGDSDEFINVFSFDLIDINKMIDNGKIFDSKTISSIKMFENFYFNELKKKKN